MTDYRGQKIMSGIDRKITRRDFLNGALIGAGSALLQLPSPFRLLAQTREREDYGGIGDYAGSVGNTEQIVKIAHGFRDGLYDNIGSNIIDTGETFDMAVIGGGLSGLAAAFQFIKTAGSKKKCLIIENHSVFGGEAKRNEFMVNGQRLIAPQASNSFVVIDNPDSRGYDIYSELGIPKSFEYQKLTNADKSLSFDRTNYGFMIWHDDKPDIGWLFGEKWAADIWKQRLTNTPFPESVKQDFLTWRSSSKKHYEGEDFRQWLDTMSYKDYIEKVLGLSPEITKFIDPVIACSLGLASDAVSAFCAYQISMPGFQGFTEGFSEKARPEAGEWHSFPGGNDGFTRRFVKRLIPDAIHGNDSFGDIMNGRINFDATDRPGNSVRIRLNALAVNIKHNSEPDKSEYVGVVYVKDGKLYRLKAKGIVMASGSWTARRVIKDLPEDYKKAYEEFYRSPILVINVALTNWRFLYRLGLTACRWFDGFGFSCNIRQPMMAGDYRPPLDPDKPVVLTFYVPFYYPGMPVKEQGITGRMELLSTSYADYEFRIKEQMLRLFGSAGFDPKRDIAGIILNRWGHAFVNPQPGFYFGKGGMHPARDIIRKRFGRIAFAHSELNGHQHWLGAVEEGRRAAKHISEIL
ncbi:MAG TPA: FAD-dependent oxidoreductase [Nitrospiraceae bacterium]|nr:FAD-dependent oxidoreductase [Nitrospiraceae bacterium]